MRRIALLLGLILFSVIPYRAQTTDDTEARLKALEARIGALEAEIQSLKAAKAGEEKAPASRAPEPQAGTAAAPAAPAAVTATPSGPGEFGGQLPGYGAGRAAGQNLDPDINGDCGFPGANGQKPLGPRPRARIHQAP